MGWAGNTLTPREAAQWIVTCRTLDAAARKTRLSRRLRGPGADRGRPGRTRLSGRRRFRHTGTTRICVLEADGAFLEGERE
eukprot:7954475-Lingulodinium_polyedra.AAC.1